MDKTFRENLEQKIKNNEILKNKIKNSFPQKTERELRKIENIIHNTIIECFEIAIPVYKIDKNTRNIIETMIEFILLNCEEDYKIKFDVLFDKFFNLLDKLIT